ncbi:MAG: adenylate/guanylate cyclase domain-containing protein [Spirochaetaceae bacterium]|nr:adenylate/guanylate cyclase domain-containing protein [Spirochaetaceae bacterium]
MERQSVLDELVRASSRLSSESDFLSLVSVLVEQSADHSRSDLACLYVYDNPDSSTGPMRMIYRRGLRDVPNQIAEGTELMDFVEECGEAVVLSERNGSPFDELFLEGGMKSGIVLPVKTGRRRVGALFLNSREERHYGNERFRYLDSLTRLAGGLLENARLLKELREYLAKIEALERYQESIFRSMTNLLVTTDKEGNIRYFNDAAAEAFELQEQDMGIEFTDRFGKGLGKKMLNTIGKARSDQREYAGLEGIFKKPSGDEMDYALNVAPLQGSGGRCDGITLLFTDQTRERDLKAQADVAVEERRHIKDMFSRYLSMDLVKNIMENPDLVRPGGDKKTATVFFADITGYTAFSEGKDPAYIIDVLNGFFNEAVELVIDNHGYIDKFIGDCIMAAWGVPMKTDEEDAILAVKSALMIHELVRSKDRTFFRGDAEKLKISIGMASGPLVAGNVGSSRRMDYTVLGDTVNTAARLESVATAEEIIITQSTRDLLGDHFKLEERKPVKVKGKEKPLVIFNVKGIN